MRALPRQPRRIPAGSREPGSAPGEICALTADGLNLAGIRRILELQEETSQLRAELAALREQAAGTASRGGARPARSTAEPSPPGN